MVPPLSATMLVDLINNSNVVLLSNTLFLGHKLRVEAKENVRVCQKNNVRNSFAVQCPTTLLTQYEMLFEHWN